jgi:hypothetical protein
MVNYISGLVFVILLVLGFVVLGRTGQPRLGFRAGRPLLPPGPPLPAAPPVQRTVLHAGVKVRGRVGRPVPRPPEANERFLHDVLGVGATRHALLREKDQRPTMSVEPDCPIILNARHEPPPASGKALSLIKTPPGRQSV